MASKACQAGSVGLRQLSSHLRCPRGDALDKRGIRRSHRSFRTGGSRLSFATPRLLVSAFQSPVWPYANISLQDACGISGDDRPGGDITRNYRPRRDDALVPNSHSRADQTAPSDEAAFTDFDWTIRSGHPIVRQDQCLEGYICLAADPDGSLGLTDKSASHRDVDRAVELNTESPAQKPPSHCDGECPQTLKLIE